MSPVDPGVVVLLLGVMLAVGGLCTLQLAHDFLPLLAGIAAIFLAMGIALCGMVITAIAGSLWCIPLGLAASVLLLVGWAALMLD